MFGGMENSLYLCGVVTLWMQDCVRQLQRNAVLFVNLKQWVIGTFTSVSVLD